MTTIVRVTVSCPGDKEVYAVLKRMDLLSIGLMLLAILLGGCSAINRQPWPSPTMATPDFTYVGEESKVANSNDDLGKAEIAYAKAIELSFRKNEKCVEEFFCAALNAWPVTICPDVELSKRKVRATEIYQSSLVGLVREGQRYGRLDPKIGLRIRAKEGWLLIPANLHGFPRDPDEFDHLLVVGEYSLKGLINSYRSPGVGIPVVALRDRVRGEQFQMEKQPFAATVVLRPTGSEGEHSHGIAVLDLYDSSHLTAVNEGQICLPLAIDKTAPFARVLGTANRTILQSFLQPGTLRANEKGLFMCEPYQPGKIPVVFIHGLLSDRFTWVSMIHEIHGRPEFKEHYQAWVFNYPTGEPFLHSASLLRHQLAQIRKLLDPEGIDPALDQVVLVGHSMGGLISKIQVADSGNHLWDSLANRPIERVKMSSYARARFSDVAFFRASPTVTRVVFIGTPHQGSAFAHLSIGRTGTMLIDAPEDLKREHRKLLEDNPCTFSEEFVRHVPTSIDMLDPNSKLLKAIRCLPIAPGVQTHTILGHGNVLLGEGDSDAVVPVESARYPGTVSELRVDEKHWNLTANPIAIEGVLDVLRRHQRERSIDVEEMVPDKSIDKNISEQTWRSRLRVSRTEP